MELNYNSDTLLEQYHSLDDLIITNQPINDQYIYILYQQFKELKKKRKKKELETNILTSRVNCLKLEEEKILKKLEYTKKKTNDKIALIEKLNSKLEQQIKIKEQNKRELEYRKEKNKKQRESIEKALLNKKDKIQNAIREVRMVKEQQKSIEDYLKDLRIKEIYTKKSNNEKIKSQLMMNSTKRRDVYLEKKTKIKAELENKIQIEMNIKEENDDKIRQMHILEEEIVKRIQETIRMNKKRKLEYCYSLIF